MGCVFRRVVLSRGLVEMRVRTLQCKCQTRKHERKSEVLLEVHVDCRVDEQTAANQIPNQTCQAMANRKEQDKNRRWSRSLDYC